MNNFIRQYEKPNSRADLCFSEDSFIFALIERTKSSGGAEIGPLCLRIIAILARSEECQRVLCKAGVIGVILRLMTLGDLEVQEEACRALANLATTESTKNEIREQGGIDRLLLAMKANPETVTLQINACGAIYNMTNANVENQAAFGDRGAINAVLLAMKTHKENGDIQAIGCRALWGLASHQGVRNGIVSQGGVSVVVESMQHHLQNASVQRGGCEVLSALKVGPLGDVVNGVVSGMVTHSPSLKVQLAACKTIADMIKNSEGTMLKANAAMIGAVVSASKLDPSNQKLQAIILEILLGIQISPQSISSILSEGGLDIALLVMKTFHDNASIQSNVAQLLAKLTTDSVARSAIVARDGVGLVTRAMRTFPTREPLIEACCALLADLAADDVYLLTVRSEGGEVAAYRAMELHQKSRTIQQQALRLRKNLSRLNTVSQQATQQPIDRSSTQCQQQ